MPDYTSLGFNDFLLRPLEASFTEKVGLDSSSSFEQISGLQIKGDKITSLNKSLSLDLENNSFTVRDGDVNRVEMGKLSDGSIGLIIRDNQGNVLMNISGTVNKITSPTGNLEVDFNEERILIKNEGGIPTVLIGKQQNGF